MGRGIASPGSDLYVYVLEGRLGKAEEECLGPSFIGNWIEEGSSFLFFSGPSDEKVIRVVRGREDIRLVEEHHYTYEQWHGGEPRSITVGDVILKMPWETGERGKGLREVLLDPGVVFGTGLHPTTEACLEALDLVRRKRGIGGVRDLGTGSGILALAAAAMGAQRITAVDINPLSVRTARRNVSLNGLEEIIEVHEGRAEDFVHELADLLIANIHHEVIARIVSMISPRSTKRIIVSGLLKGQAEEIRERLHEKGFHVYKEWVNEGRWSTFLADSSEG